MPNFPARTDSADPKVSEPASWALQAVLLTGSAALLLVWVLEWQSGVITPWDRWLLPSVAAVVAGSAIVMLRRPAWSSALLPVPVMAFSASLAVTLHMSLLFGAAENQWYQTLTGLYWVPLSYGCAFVFLPLRAALWVSGVTALAVFAPLPLWAQMGRLPAWTHEAGPLLWVIALANAMYLILLAGVLGLRRSQAQAQAHMEVMRELASTDVLTGLPNRRAMVETLERAQALARRGGQPVSVALVDVDHFKQVNDRFGRAAGDAVLVQLGEVMRTQLRASDVLARWGGEEFLFCAPATPVSAAAELAERVRKVVSEWVFPHGERVTLSIGLTQCLASDDVDTLLKRADRALYQAKSAGRDRTVTLAIEASTASGR